MNNSNFIIIWYTKEKLIDVFVMNTSEIVKERSSIRKCAKFKDVTAWCIPGIQKDKLFSKCKKRLVRRQAKSFRGENSRKPPYLESLSPISINPLAFLDLTKFRSRPNDPHRVGTRSDKVLYWFLNRIPRGRYAKEFLPWESYYITQVSIIRSVWLFNKYPMFYFFLLSTYL